VNWLSLGGLSALVLLAGACGARDSLPVGMGGAAPVENVGGVDCAPEGVRLCGGPCPPPEAIDCAGDGCTPTAHRDDLSPADMGVCWPDLDAWVSSPCIACEEDEACLHRAAGGLWCVPREVCSTLFAMGRADLCRYPDKTPFTDQPLAEAPGCPAVDTTLCGGGCGECAPFDFCVGRSATRPFGLCVDNVSGPTQCSPDDPTLQGACYELLEYCATFRTEPADQGVANQYGVCEPEERCLAAAAAGVVACYDIYGQPVEP
jgi:hypothetical protein